MMDEQMNVLGAPKKIVDGLVEVFEGFARMFEGVSEQLELLAEDAVETLEDKPAFPAKELLPVKVIRLRWLMMQLPQMLIRQRIP